MLGDWSALDTWIVITAALAAMSCALPGTWLLLRRQSLLGDAISHAVLPGIVLAYLLVHQLQHAGVITRETALLIRHPCLFAGAAITGILSGWLSDQLARLGRLDSGAALGVVYTSMFAAGLLLIRLAADRAHIDPGCVLYGNLETIVTDTWGKTGVPRAVVINGALFLMNVVLMFLFYKELTVCVFDPAMAISIGIPANRVQQALLACTGATVVASFESVGSILVIAMLVVPPACAVLLTERLSRVLTIAVLIAAAAALGGHVAALTVPALVRQVLQWPELGDATTAGMMAVAAGGLFLGCWVLSPQDGLIRQYRDQWRLRDRILDEDVLGTLFRRGHELSQPWTLADLARLTDVPQTRLQESLKRLQRLEHVVAVEGGYLLSETGAQRAQGLVRSHRLWESYLAEHFQLTDRQLHHSAEQVEHYLDRDLREHLAEELHQPVQDPHGARIPPAGDAAPSR